MGRLINSLVAFASIIACLLNLAQGFVSREPLYEWYKGVDPANVIYAVNCGSSEEYEDKNGVVWVADQDFEGGVQSKEGGNDRWFMPDTELYHTERYGDNQSFSYRMPIDATKTAKYTLVLKFSEVYFWEEGMKVFDVLIGDSVVLKSVDPFAAAGSKRLPHDEFIVIETRSGELYIEGKKAKGRPLVEGGSKMEITFKVGSADNPKINAIMLVQGGPENTHK